MSAPEEAANGASGQRANLDAAPGVGLYDWGWVFLVLGAIGIGASWLIPITVAQGQGYGADYVVNAYRAQLQMHVLVLGVGLFVAGAIFFAASKIIAAIRALGGKI